MRAGTVIAGRYRLLQPLGAGAMGQVWRASDERLQRDVAVKVVDLTASAGLVSPQQVQREVLATARLDHPAIVTMFDGGVESKVAYLVMELVRGESLAERLQRGPLPVAEAVRIASEIARALDSTHLIGVVHRDIKPGNVMLASGGRVKVLDFGIARLVGEPTEAPGTPVVGTAAYMAPEQATGSSVGPASDIYALGCLLMAMVAGRPPFQGMTSVEIAWKQVHEPPPRLTSLRADAPPALDGLVAAMLAKQPRDRPDAAAVARALGSVGGDASGSAAATAALPGGVPVPTGAAAPSDPSANHATAVLAAAGAPATAVLPTDSGHAATAVLPDAMSNAGTAVLPDAPHRTAVLDGHAAGTAVLPSAAPSQGAWGAPPTDARRLPLPPPGASSPPSQPPGGAAVTRGYSGGLGAGRRVSYRKVARFIIIAMVVLLAFGAAVQGVPRLIGLMSGGGATPSPVPSKASSSTTTSTTSTTTTTSAPSRPSSSWSPTLPSIPNPSGAALSGAVGGVSSVLDSWSPTGGQQRSAKSRLTAKWASASKHILAGDGAQEALDEFTADVNAERDKGNVPVGVYAALVVTLATVDAQV